MEPVYSKNFKQIDDFCDQLLQFVEAARRFEVEGQGAILAYSFISEYASKIRISAEERLRTLARIQYEQAFDEEVWDFHGMESPLDFQACAAGGRKGRGV